MACRSDLRSGRCLLEDGTTAGSSSPFNAFPAGTADELLHNPCSRWSWHDERSSVLRPPPMLQPHLEDAGAAADKVNFPPTNQHLGRLATKLSQHSKAH